jgi:hypothetical protein
MWIPFIAALALELLRKAEKVTTAIKYIIASVILSTVLNLILTMVYPAQAESIAIEIYLFITAVASILGFITAKILRAVAGAK